MWPYCGARHDTLEPGDPRLAMMDWDCVRSVVLGVASLAVLLLGGYAATKIGVVFARTGWYALNLLMLSLATTQCLLTTIKYMLVKEQLLTFSAAYFRGLQTLLTCANYAKSAAESHGDPEFFSKYFFPILGFLVFYLTVVFLVAVGTPDFDCYHPHWMIMTVSQFFIVCLFTIPGLSVMKRLSGALNLRREYFSSMNVDQNEFIQQKKGLTVLLIANATGALAQLILDSWLQSQYADQKECIIFDTGFEEVMRILLKILSYDMPVIATVYVYYILPRRQFDTSLDIRLSSASLDDAFTTELLET